MFEIDSQPKLDIYGDFEYNLEDDDFVGANVVKTSELLIILVFEIGLEMDVMDVNLRETVAQAV